MTLDVAEFSQRIRAGVDRVVVGADRSSYAMLVAFLARGHVLVEGVPGTGKTLLVRTFARLLGLEYRRIQFTPDLMPADIVGTTIFNPQSAEFTMRRGPLFANVILADEINRTPAKTQAALLEAMEESQVTLDGTTVALEPPFFVCATQNPIEYEGTYQLPEAQLDRFLVKINAEYPPRDAELALLRRVSEGFDAHHLDESGVNAVVNRDEVLRAQAAIRRVHLAAEVQTYCYEIVAATRRHRHVALGASPRCAVALVLASQAAAAMAGRDYVTPDDLKEIAGYVLAHRLLIAPEAEVEGVRSLDVVRDVLASVPIPRA